MSSLLFYFTKIISMKNLIGSKSRSAIIIAILFIIFSISNGCTKNTMSDLTGTIGPKDNSGFKGGTDTTEVIISGMGFSPATITIAAGTTITWTNKDEVVNIVTSETGLFNGVISSNETYSYMFSTAGNYQYFNRVHPSITGNIIVN